MSTAFESGDDALEIPCGRFVYRLRIHANAGLPPEHAPADFGDGFPLVLIARPPDAAQDDHPADASGKSAPAAGAQNPIDELPRERVRLALFWIAQDPRQAAGEGAASGSRPARVIENIETMLADGQAVSSAIESLGELASEYRLQIQGCVIELAAGGVGEAGGLDDETLERILPKRFHAALADERAREATLAYVQVCTAGLPPLVHVHSGGIIFPVRSWVPAGLYPDWQPLCQSIECEVGDRLVVHTELAAAAASLKAFHQSLQSGAGDWSLFSPVSGAAPSGPASRAALELCIEARAEVSS